MGAAEAGFELVEHPADIGIRFWGRTLGEAFIQAALALRAMLAGDSAPRETRALTLDVTGADRLELLLNWLTELLVRFDADQLVLGRFELQAVSDHAIRAVAYGEPYDPSRHQTPYYVKAITYHQMALDQRKDGWHGQVYVDI